MIEFLAPEELSERGYPAKAMTYADYMATLGKDPKLTPEEAKRIADAFKFKLSAGERAHLASKAEMCDNIDKATELAQAKGAKNVKQAKEKPAVAT